MARLNPFPFDTHRFVKRMTEAGMPLAQAEALADERIALVNSRLATREDLAKCATKEDLERFATKDEVAVLRTEVAVLRARIGLVLWLVSSVGGGVAFLVVRTIWTG